MIHELALYLSQKGYPVDLLTSKQGKLKITQEGSLRVVYHPWIKHPVLLRRNLWYFHAFAFSCLRSLLSNSYDLIYCTFHPDGLAAYLNRIVKQTPYIMQATSVPFNVYFQNKPVDQSMFKAAIGHCTACLFPSHFAKRSVKVDYGKGGRVIPMPVDTTKFRPETSKKDFRNPRVLCTSAVNDPRKGVPLLVRAFRRFLEKHPGSILQLSGQVDEETMKRLLSLVDERTGRAIQFLGHGCLEDLPNLYAAATMTVLPSKKEVFGMVLTESLAAGTPVVGSNSGAIPEVIRESSIGTLFDLDEEESVGGERNAVRLYEAMCETLLKARNQKTVLRCAEYARQYDWNAVGPKIEAFFKEVTEAA